MIGKHVTASILPSSWFKRGWKTIKDSSKFKIPWRLPPRSHENPRWVEDDIHHEGVNLIPLFVFLQTLQMLQRVFHPYDLLQRIPQLSHTPYVHLLYNGLSPQSWRIWSNSWFQDVHIQVCTSQGKSLFTIHVSFLQGSIRAKQSRVKTCPKPAALQKSVQKSKTSGLKIFCLKYRSSSSKTEKPGIYFHLQACNNLNMAREKYVLVG